MPLSHVYRLPSGRVVHLQMPNLPALLLTTGHVPNVALLAALNILVKDGLWQPEKATEEEQRRRKRAEVMGWYGVAALTLVSPRLVLPPARPRPDADEIGPDDLTLEDVEVIYGYFRYGDPAAAGGGGGGAGAEPVGAADGGAASGAVEHAPG